MRMASDSKKPIALNAQQVPLRDWFFTDVMGFSFTVVNSYSGIAGAGRCANADAQANNAAAIARYLFIIR